ncbi:unnamed protein product [Heterobilharzia americana]|nr:unnamed protein product [Heterobilharzia americana]
MLTDHHMSSLLKPEILIPESIDNEFIELDKDLHISLPLKISSFAYKLPSNPRQNDIHDIDDGDILQTTCLVVQVSGWKPIYPITVNRLGTFHRVLERLTDTEFETLKNEHGECWKYNLPVCNRLIIDIILDKNGQYIIYLRSGLTITNDLNQSIKIGLEILPKLSSTPAEIDSSSGYLKNTSCEPILLTVCKPRHTYSVPINLVGLMSLRLANLCFSPAKTIMIRQSISVSSFINTSMDQNKFNDDLYDWASVYYHHHNPVMNDEEEDDEQQHQQTTQQQLIHSSEMIDWTCLKQSDDLLEAILISTRRLPASSCTIPSVNSIQRLFPVYQNKKSMLNYGINKFYMCITVLFPVQTINFGIHLDGFPKCEPLSIPSHTYNQKVLIRLYDSMNRPLELQVNVCSRAFGARHLTVSGLICLINNSGLPLIFAQSSNQPYTSSQASTLAAGQNKEHEEACVLMPLLFSFANKSEGYLLRVRIGKGFNNGLLDQKKDEVSIRNTGRCTWSPGISLDKPGVDTIQLKVYSENNCLSSISYLGFEVNTGQDSHLPASTIVTFRPRYIIENYTRYTLHLTQRYCLTTSNNLPAFVSVHPNCSQAFHWSSEDLDRLLCIRAVLQL